MGKKNIEAVYRLSPVQEGMLFHTLESAKPSVYLTQYSCILTGEIDCGHFQRAWEATVRRHPVLRTLFTWEQPDKPLQIVREVVSLPWDELDWRAFSPEDQFSRWHSLLQRDRDRGFDLEKAPLIRLTLIRLAPERYRFLWTFQHMLMDGWSVRLVFDEVSRYYRAFCAGEELKVSPAPEYARYISWIGKRDDSAADTYWSQALKGFATPTSPAAGQASNHWSAKQSVSGCVSMTVDSILTKDLLSFASSERLTPNTLALGAWALVLGKYADADDVVFGTTVSGRPVDLPGAEHTFGLFINTLPMRVQLVPDLRIVQWLREIQSQQIRLREHEQTPLANVQRVSDLPPGTALFDSIVVYENVPDSDSNSSSGYALSRSDEEFREYSNYPLALLILPGEELQIQARFDTRTYQQDFVSRMLDHFQNVLSGITQHANEAVSNLSLSTESELEQLVQTWNLTQAEFPDSKCIHQLIEQSAESVPDAVALVSDDRELSYAELNRRANKLARHIVQLGVGPDFCVGVFFERSIEAVIAILAVLKAGGAYVPLDPTFPRDRLGYVLDDLRDAGRAGRAGNGGGMALIVTREQLLGQLPDDGYRTVCIDRDWSLIDENDDSNPNMPVDPEQLAYVIYTSGSTGRPKGVMIPHRNLVNSTIARSAYYPEVLSGFLLLSSLATDSSVAGLFWALSTGASLIVPRVRVEQDIFELLEIIEKKTVSHLLCVPSLYQLILEHSGQGQLSSMKAVIVAGEACPGKVVALHGDKLPGVSLYNEYGPSEGTVWVTAAKLDDVRPDGCVPIGRPINNLTTYVLDRQGKPTPLGLPGELYVGGAGVARGYLNQPDRTGEVFVCNPFRSDPDPVLYKTGDMVRYLDDGNIEFLGRVDNQVKIRGYRVELEEIEQTLKSHPRVNDAVVVLEQSALDSANNGSSGSESLANLLMSDDTGTAEQILAEIEQLDDEEIDLMLQTSGSEHILTGSSQV